MKLPPQLGRGPACGTRRGFTLIEVILAIVIAVGMLVVVLYFYQQTADLRTQLIQESERISSVRLLMDRITGELRAASALSSSRIAFAGDATSMRFITVCLPVRSAWNAGPSGRLVTPQTDLKLVSYHLGRSIERSNVVVAGLVRTEQPTVDVRPRAAPARTNEVAGEREAKPAPATRGPEPVTDAIRYVRFRYWGGDDWKESWSAVELPKAVEISFGGEPLPDSTAPDDYAFDLYRRVIYLPGSEASGGLSTISVMTDEGLPGEETP
jgi:prepilin-type N-terminal cleavage/methylation domain-containing protein